jgi:hypothetical protein
MVTTSTAGSAVTLLRSGLYALILAVFITVQAGALAHEWQHVLGQHEAPCGLHVIADHLAMVPAPEPVLAVALAPAAGPVSPHADVLLPAPARPRTARAPPSQS